MNIIARKPRTSDSEYVVVDRATSRGCYYHRYVVATVTPRTLAHGEWVWGHYFASLVDAVSYFNKAE